LRGGGAVEEGERGLGAQVARFSRAGSCVRQPSAPLTRANPKVVPALRADAEVRLELVVAVVRPARGARVRVLSGAVRIVGAMLVLDRDVYAWLGQGPSIIAQISRRSGSSARRASRPARRPAPLRSDSPRRLPG